MKNAGKGCEGGAGRAGLFEDHSFGLPGATGSEDIRGGVNTEPPAWAWTCAHASVSNKHQQARRARAGAAVAAVSPAGGTCL